MSTQRLPTNVVALGIVSFLTDFSNEVAFRALPFFLANVLGVQAAVIGLVEGVADATATFMRLASGWLSDHLRKRKFLVLIGYGLSLLVKPVLFLTTTWPQAFAVRFLDRVGKGVRAAPRDALVADSSAREQFGRTFGFHKTLDLLGTASGLAVAAFVVWQMQGGQSGLAATTYRFLVLLSIVPAFLAIVILAFFTRDVDSNSKPPQAQPMRLRESAVVSPAFRRYLLVTFLFTLGNSSDAFLLLKAQSTGMGLSAIFLLFTALSLASALVALYAGSLSDTIGRRSLLIWGWMLFSVTYAGVALATTAWHFWMLILLYAAYQGFTLGAQKAMVTDLTYREARGKAYGLFHTTVGVATFPASLLAGVLWQSVSPAAPFIFGSALALVSAIALFVSIPEKGTAEP